MKKAKKVTKKRATKKNEAPDVVVSIPERGLSIQLKGENNRMLGTFIFGRDGFRFLPPKYKNKESKEVNYRMLQNLYSFLAR